MPFPHSLPLGSKRSVTRRYRLPDYGLRPWNLAVTELLLVISVFLAGSRLPPESLGAAAAAVLLIYFYCLALMIPLPAAGLSSLIRIGFVPDAIRGIDSTISLKPSMLRDFTGTLLFTGLVWGGLGLLLLQTLLTKPGSPWIPDISLSAVEPAAFCVIPLLLLATSKLALRGIRIATGIQQKRWLTRILLREEWSVLFGGAALVTVIYFFREGFRLSPVTVVASVAVAVTTAALFRLVQVIVASSGISFQPRFIARLAGIDWRSNLNLLCEALWRRADILMLAVLGSGGMLGWYVLASLLAGLVAAFTPVICGSAVLYLPTAGNSASRSGVFKFARRSVAVAVVLAAALAGASYLMTSKWMGGEYLAAYPAILILLPGMLCDGVLRTQTLAMQGANVAIPRFLIASICLVFNIGLNLLFIPQFGMVGAALVALLTRILALALTVHFTIYGAQATLADLLSVSFADFKPVHIGRKNAGFSVNSLPPS